MKTIIEQIRLIENKRRQKAKKNNGKSTLARKEKYFNNLN